MSAFKLILRLRCPMDLDSGFCFCNMLEKVCSIFDEEMLGFPGKLFSSMD